MNLSPRHSRESAKAGFTLLELLVVVAIIAVLAGLLLPALSLAKSKARQILCMASQKQLALASELYGTDSLGFFVPNGHGHPDSEETPRTWVAGDSHFFLPGFTNTQYLVDERYAAFASYIPTAKLYKCPADKAVVKRAGAMNIPQIRSYAMNAFVGWSVDEEELTPGYRVYRRGGDFSVKSPADIFLFQEVHPNSICMPAFLTHMPGAPVDGFYHYPSSLHRGGSWVTFVDGHTERHVWTDRRTRKPVNDGMLAHADRSPGNADVQWLREHATRSLTDWGTVASATGFGSTASSASGN